MKKNSLLLIASFVLLAASWLLAQATTKPVAKPAVQVQERVLNINGGQVIIRGGGRLVIGDQVFSADDEDATETVPSVSPPPPPAEPAEPGSRVRTVDRVYTRVMAPGSISLPAGGKDAAASFTVDGKKIDVKLEDVIRIDFCPGSGQSAVERMPDNAVALLLTNGEWLAGLISGGDARNVRVAMVGVGELVVPLRSVRGIITPAGRTGRNLVQLERTLLVDRPQGGDGQPAAASDTLHLANGETVLGTIVEINPKGCSVQGPLGQLKVDFDVLTVAELSNPLDAVVGRELPLAAWVELTNGSKLLASRLEHRGNNMKLTRPGSEAPISLDMAAVYAVETVNGRWCWLDGFKPLLAEHSPFLTVRWPPRFGVNVVGSSIRVGDAGYSHGIGVHSASRVIFPVKGATRFHCIAGLDSTAGPLADVDVQVVLDENVVLESKSVKHGSKPIPIDIPLNGAQKLELRVNFGANGDVQDRFNWADAAVLY